MVQNNRDDRSTARNIVEPHESDAHLDPITGEPGAHPVGTGVGAAAAGTIGTAIGALGGPLGAVIGAAVGSIVGGLVGKSTAEAINPTVEDSYWQDNYQSRPYVNRQRTYQDYQPAYKTGYEGYARYAESGKTYSEVEADLQRDYQQRHPNGIPWTEAAPATRDAWHRAEENTFLHSQDSYWQEKHADRPYAAPNAEYKPYRAAYRTGYEGYLRYSGSGKSYDELEPDLRRDYEQRHSDSDLPWDEAKQAVREAWFKLEESFRNRRTAQQI